MKKTSYNKRNKKMIRNNIYLTLFLVLPFITNGQNPIPADTNSMSILLMNGKVYTGSSVISNGIIGIRNGKIELVGDASTVRIDPSRYDTVIHAEGKNIYPGIIALNTTLGINEIAAVRATNDMNETGKFNASSRALIAYNTDSRVTPTVRSNGILLAQVVPQGGRVSGNSSIMELDGWNWEDAVLKADDGIHIRWPSQVVNRKKEAAKEKEQVAANLEELRELEKFFYDARAYCNQSSPSPVNLQFESMRGIFLGEKKLYIHCNHAKDIVSAINFSSALNVSMILVGGQDAHLLTSELNEHNIPVIIGDTHRLPMREDDDIDQPYKLPALLKKAGVDFAISADGFWNVRNLPFHAGTACAYGLSEEDAIASITSAAARITGIDERVGTIEEGKDATLIISSGDILDMRHSSVEKALIRGKFIDLDDIQKKLYRKYSGKFNLDH
jgi:imidazolonepropionase-like amidohydrolase